MISKKDLIVFSNNKGEFFIYFFLQQKKRGPLLNLYTTKCNVGAQGLIQASKNNLCCFSHIAISDLFYFEDVQ